MSADVREGARKWGNLLRDAARHTSRWCVSCACTLSGETCFMMPRATPVVGVSDSFSLSVPGQPVCPEAALRSEAEGKPAARGHELIVVHGLTVHRI